MDVTILSIDDVAVGTAQAVELQHEEEQFTLFAKIPLSCALAANQGIGFRCIDGRYRIFEIIKREIVEPDGVWEIQAIDKAVRELMEEPVTDIRARNSTISDYVGRLIQNTRFTLGTVTTYESGTTSAYYQSVWSALENAANVFGVNIIPYYIFENGAVVERRIDITATVGANRGRIFELGDDMSAIRISYDESNIVTALYGRGKGVEIEGGEDDEASYGRRLTFADATWSTLSGDPADKPEGQEWVGDPAALAQFGRAGRHRFGFAVFEDITDPDALLDVTWELLQERKQPAITINASVYDTERIMGRSHEAVRLGDPVLVRLPKRGIDINAQITAIKRDYIKPEETQLTIANASAVTGPVSASRIIAGLQTTVSGVQAKAGAWDRAGEAFNIDGALDVMNNQIISTVGNWHTDPDTGAIMMESADGLKAMRLNGAGWQIANGKTGDAWNWRTAATGAGIVADEITTGRLNAGLVTVGGTGTTIDGTSVTVKHPNISPTAQTVIDSDGLRMQNAGVTLGGILQQGGTYVAAVQQIYNPANPLFRSDVGSYAGIGESMLGLNFRYNGGVGGIVGAYSNDGSTVSGLGIRNSTTSPLYIDAQNSDIIFVFRHNGHAQTMSADYIYQFILDHTD